jgi:hypothetical protein
MICANGAPAAAGGIERFCADCRARGSAIPFTGSVQDAGRAGVQ